MRALICSNPGYPLPVLRTERPPGISDAHDHGKGRDALLRSVSATTEARRAGIRWELKVAVLLIAEAFAEESANRQGADTATRLDQRSASRFL